MAYAVTHHFPDGTEEQYQAALASVHPDNGKAGRANLTTLLARPRTAG